MNGLLCDRARLGRPAAIHRPARARAAPPTRRPALTKTYFEELMQEFGCHSRDGIAMGEKDGLPYSAELLQGGEEPEILLRVVVKSIPRGLLSQLKKEKIPHVKWFAENDEQGEALLALYSPPSSFYTKSGIHGLLHQLSQLKQQGTIAPPDTCPLCGLPACDARFYWQQGYRPVHTACVQTRLQLPEKDEIIPARPGGNVFTGAVGALLGAVIATLPIFTFALNDGVLHWALYAFIPLLSALCYRLLRGRGSSGWAAGLVMGSSLLCAFAMELVWFWIRLSAQSPKPVPFVFSLQQYFATHTFVTTVQEMFSCLLALLAGYLAAAVLLRRYVQDVVVPRHRVRGAAYVRETVAPASDTGAAVPDHHPDQPPGADA